MKAEIIVPRKKRTYGEEARKKCFEGFVWVMREYDLRCCNEVLAGVESIDESPKALRLREKCRKAAARLLRMLLDREPTENEVARLIW